MKDDFFINNCIFKVPRFQCFFDFWDTAKIFSDFTRKLIEGKVSGKFPVLPKQFKADFNAGFEGQFFL